MEFLTSDSIWIYVLIFVGRIVQTFMGILWLILVNRGERLASTLVMGVSTGMFIIITGTVLVGFQDDMLKSVIYVLATALGTYIGSTIEEKLALGLSSMQVIVPQDNMAGEKSSVCLAKVLRRKDFAVTVMHGKGKLGMRDILTLHIKRKRINEAIKLIKKEEENAVIIVNDIRSMSGRYLQGRLAK